MRPESTPPTLALPPRPEQRPPSSVSLVLVLAPLAGSLLLWAVTGSSLSLALAAIAPMLVLGSAAEGRWRARRERRRNGSRYAELLAGLELEIDAAHARERAVAGDRLPTAGGWFSGARAGERWRTPPHEPLLARIGRAELRSGLRLTPERAGAEPADVARMRAIAGRLPDAPLGVDLRRGLCVIGRGAAADALLRSVLVQALCRVPPTARVEVAGSPEPWFPRVPHPMRIRAGSGTTRIVVDDGGAVATLVRTPEPEHLPADCDAVVAVGAGGGRVLRHPELEPGTAFLPEALSALEADRFAVLLAATERPGEERLPDRVALGPLITTGPARTRNAGSLRCPIGVGRDGAVEVDLVTDGPHAVIGGTTGSGKSELLRTWVLAIAARNPPSAVQFLLLDFKGGATFADLAALPHTVGVLTDLHQPSVSRAVASIRAELLHRERLLAEAGARGVDDPGVPGLSRLVLVVDEFAALAEQLPECHAVLGDVAARGRSLGVHLILCTQRPSGVVRDALLANAGLRICLRVTSADDSRAVVGVPDAAAIHHVGRAVLAAAGRTAPVQVAEAEPGRPAAVAAAWPQQQLRRPWLPELPVHVAPEELPGGPGLVFALADRPERQAQPPAAWDPRRSGALLVLGGPRSGRSTALAAVAAAAGAPGTVLWPRPSVPCVWDAVGEALDRLETDRQEPALLLLDDVDAVFAAAGGEYGHELAERLLRVLREGAGAVAVALAASRLPSQLGAVTALSGSRLLLRAASRDEHVLAGGTAGGFDRAAPPGRGELDGVLVQVALASRTSTAPAERTLPLQPLPGLLAVSSRPGPLAAALGAAPAERLAGLAPPAAGPAAGAGGVLVGTPDEWQARWSVFRQLAAVEPVLFDGCTPAEVRSLLGRAELPPPCSGRPRWLFRPGEPAVRVRVDGPG